MADTLWTIPFAAKTWGVSVALVRKWVEQGRVSTGTVQVGARMFTIVLDHTRPDRAVPGTLDPTAKVAAKNWKRGGGT